MEKDIDNWAEELIALQEANQGLQQRLTRYEEAVRVEGFIGRDNNLVLYESHNKFDMEQGQKVTVMVFPAQQ